ncbi:MAG: DNA polymerase [Blastochloris sp.]|nr:DNA polymerase [Blastochloris sp.]
MPLRSLVVDFNSFFASVEQQEDPRLRGKPVGVVPLMSDSTCCIAASYEAKHFGVKTGTNVGEAKKMCPGLHLIEARHAKYVKYHHALVEAVESCLHVDRVMSIDEMACELPTNLRATEQTLSLARRIKQTISQKVGAQLRCSIGIAPNVFLAKTASDMQKPDGLVVLQSEDLPHRLHTLELRDLCGIGHNMEERLHRHGIFTVKALCQADKELLHKVWGGIEGERMYDRLRGEEVWQPATNKTTIGHSHVLPPAKRNDASALAILDRLLQKALTRLRKSGHLCAGLHLSLKYTDKARWAHDITFQETQDTLECLRLLQQLWKQRPQRDQPLLAVGVTLFNLIAETNHTLPLFPKSATRQKLNRVMDQINEKFGKDSLYYGGAIEALQDAPMRIAFTHIPDLDLEADPD